MMTNTPPQEPRAVSSWLGMSGHRLSPGRLLSRRALLQNGLVMGGALTLAGALAACDDGSGTGPNGDGSSTAGGGAVDLSGFAPSEGSDIPTSSVNFGMTPFADYLIAIVGMEKGWYDEVGISLPLGKRMVTTEQADQQILNGQLDIAAGYVPNRIKTYGASQDSAVAYIGNIFAGNYILAAPATAAKIYDDFAADGQAFEEAFTSSVQQMKGKRIAVSDEGVPRAFFDDVLRLGGLTTDDLELQVIDDSKMVQLAKAGSIDYAFPSGAAQGIEIMRLGYYRVVGWSEMLEGLPVGSPEIANAVGYSGFQIRNDYVEQNTETVLRFFSVLYRTMDLLVEDPSEVMRIVQPALASSAGTDQSVDDMVEMFDLYFDIYTFDDANDLLKNPEYPLYYQPITQVQIDVAKETGVIPSSTPATPDDLISYRPIYDVLVGLKSDYDNLLTDNPGAIDTDLGVQAATHYAHRNYLDAYRLLAAAVAGS